MLLIPSNLLLLDEPTNHLDLDSKEVLLDALADYGGTLIFVSHDRYFVDRLANKVVEVGGGQAFVYPGGYEDFLYWKKQQEAGAATSAADRSPDRGRRRPRRSSGPRGEETTRSPLRPRRRPRPPRPPSRPPPRRTTARPHTPAPAYDAMAPRLRTGGATPDRQARERELKRMKARVTELEKRIAEKEKAVKEIEALMASPGFYDDRSRADKAANDHKALMWEVGDLMNQWESLQGEVEAKA
jgi:ATP-binding cassette subfamily F protein 3